MFWNFDFRIYQELYGRPLMHDWVVRVVFLIQILLIAIAITTFETYSWKFTGCLILICSKKIFQKRTVFEFIESWSRDQLMQKAVRIFFSLHVNYMIHLSFCLNEWEKRILRAITDLLNNTELRYLNNAAIDVKP